MNNNKYEIIATLGPASRTPQMWQEMVAAGITGFRLNTSHLSLDELEEWLEKIGSFLRRTGVDVMVTLDLQGSKWRLGKFPPFTLDPGMMVTLVLGEQTQATARLPVPHADFFQALSQSDGEVILNDARSRLLVESSGNGWAKARVMVGGEIQSRKGITLPQSDYRVDKMSQKDQQIVERTQFSNNIRYAISYLRDAHEMAHYRELLGDDCCLIAKLERQPAVDQPAAVAQWADELWVCRGDLGAELGLVRMAEVVSAVTAHLCDLSKPVFMAGQVLEHMTSHAAPTRSEVCYLHDALDAGYAGVVLSDETAVGAYPLDAVRTAALWKNV